MRIIIYLFVYDSSHFDWYVAIILLSRCTFLMKRQFKGMFNTSVMMRSRKFGVRDIVQVIIRKFPASYRPLHRTFIMGRLVNYFTSGP